MSGRPKHRNRDGQITAYALLAVGFVLTFLGLYLTWKY